MFRGLWCSRLPSSLSEKTRPPREATWSLVGSLGQGKAPGFASLGSDRITHVPRALRLIAASTATVSVTLFSLGLVVVGRGRRLEDACITEPPPQWASEFTAVRGPLADGLTTFRCVKVASPEDSFVFTDIVPLVMGVIVAIAAVSVLAVVWRWALRPSRSPLQARLTEPQDPPGEPHN